MSSPALRRACCALPFLLALYAVFLHASIGRPLWIDEFSHFVFGAQPTTAAAWRHFLSVADNIQHGQTGIYIMLNYWTLTFLGLDPTLLRLPSILSGIFLFTSAILLFRVLGLSVLWQLVLVAALTGQHLLMYFLGEARAYAPIAAAAAGLLLFYIAHPLHPRSRMVLLLGIGSALLGATIHPYFVLYWPVACLVGYVHRLATTGEAPSLRGLVFFAKPWLVACGAGLYVLLAVLTWLRGHPRFDLDPFEWLRLRGPFANFTDYSHTQFLDGSYLKAAVFTAILVLGARLLPARLRGPTRRLLAPTLLMLLSLAASLLLGWISYSADYWILLRQWVASVALFAIGMVWLWAEAARQWERLTPLLGLTAVAIAVTLVSGQALTIHRVRLDELRGRLAAPHATLPPGACEPLRRLDTANMTNDERNDAMVELANRNIACGGHVWPIFRGYYTGQPAG